jgi:catechol-2,3-dioxygenase
VTIGESGGRDGARGQGLSVYLADPEGNCLELRG